MSHDHPHTGSVSLDADNANFITVQLPPIDYRKCHSRSGSLGSLNRIPKPVDYQNSTQQDWELFGDTISEYQPSPPGPAENDGQEISNGDENLLTPVSQEYDEGHTMWSPSNIPYDLTEKGQEVTKFSQEGSLEAGDEHHRLGFFGEDIAHSHNMRDVTREYEQEDQVRKSGFGGVGERHAGEGTQDRLARGQVVRDSKGAGGEHAKAEDDDNYGIGEGEPLESKRVESGYTDSEEKVGDASQVSCIPPCTIIISLCSRRIQDEPK